MEIVNKLKNNKDFYTTKYKKYKDRQKEKKNKLSSSEFLDTVSNDYAEVLERSNKPMSRKWGKAIIDYKQMLKDMRYGNI